MRLIILLLIFISSCVNKIDSDKKKEISKWIILKDSFARKNINEFSFSKKLISSYENFHKINPKLIDSSLSEKWSSVYLYSWHETDSPFIEFTTIIHEEDRGIRMMYNILNRKDSIISSIRVAATAMEAEYQFDSYSVLKENGTILTTSSITKWFDLEKREKLKKTLGDTIKTEITFLPDGSTRERIIESKKELHLDEN